MTAQTAADLRAAADLLERDGWTQGIYHGSNGCHCAAGAIAYAIGQHVRADDMPEDGLLSLGRGWWTNPDRSLLERRNAVEDAVMQQIDDGVIIAWNDALGRTASEVIAVLRAAADAEAGQ